MSYRDIIRAKLAEEGTHGDARHVEAWMRSEFGALDALSPQAFAAEIITGVELAQDAGPEMSEALAVSLGL